MQFRLSRRDDHPHVSRDLQLENKRAVSTRRRLVNGLNADVTVARLTPRLSLFARDLCCNLSIVRATIIPTTRCTHHGDGRAGPFGAELVVRSAAVAARMRLVHLAEVERSVPPVEDALHVVRIEEKPVLLPTEIRQGRIRPEVAVQEGRLAVR